VTKLSDLKTGETGTIIKILGHGAFRKRVMEMGFVRGKNVKVELNAPLRDPIKYKVLDYEVSLRRSEADLIEVVRLGEKRPGDSPKNDSAATSVLDAEKRTINIALVGNPNCGKTSLFNFASGAHEHVGNYSGVTVDAKEGYFDYKGFHFKAVDLPGTYSLSAYSPEELYVRRYLKNEIPDVIVNVVVASNLERNLYLTTELIDMDRSMVIALNMYDELEASGAKLDYEALGKMIGVPIIPTVTKTGKGMHELFDAIIRIYEDTHETVRHVHVNLGPEIEEGITILKDSIKASDQPNQQFSPRYLAIKLLEGDSEVEDMLKKQPEYPHWMEIREKTVTHIEDVGQEDIASAIASEKYGFISGALHETYTEGEKSPSVKSTDMIDALVTHKLFGFPIFILIMWLMFWATFEIGAYPMQWISDGVEWISSLVRNFMTPGPLKDLLIDGVLGGVGGVIVFLPNILILYFCISFMEDSGYMARAAFIMDKIMHRIGLHGKSFIPLVMGFGCNVPAIMSSRIIESKSSRLITMLINPFMSCSGRLPIYILLVGIFFPHHAAWAFMGLYLLGILVAVLTAKLLRKTYFKKDETPFVMELPPYRVPTMKALTHHMWEKGEQYLKKMGGVILVGSIVIWALCYFPRDIHKSSDQMSRPEITAQMEHSYLGHIGHFIAPAMQPVGLNWKTSIALISGMPAKEIVVSTIGVLYTNDKDANLSLAQRLDPKINHQSDFTPLMALSFMVFVLLYFPCLASITALVKESGSWKYGAFSIIYNTAVAWLASFLVYQIGSLFV
jgi:ferrous iron transport protein B